MKIFNKFIWSKKEPSNKNDIWFDGSTWKMYTEEAWQSFTLPIDAADKVAKVLENASEVYQEKLNAGYGIIIEGNTISVDDSILYDDSGVWEAIETLQQNKVEQIQLNDYVPLDRYTSTSQVLMDNISELNSIKLNKTDVATINGQSLAEGGNIVIDENSKIILDFEKLGEPIEFDEEGMEMRYSKEQFENSVGMSMSEFIEKIKTSELVFLVGGGSTTSYHTIADEYTWAGYYKMVGFCTYVLFVDTTPSEEKFFVAAYDESVDLPFATTEYVDEKHAQTETKLTELSEELASNGVLIEDLQNTKIDRENDDYYPKMAVGLADNLAGVDVVDSEINFRRSGGGAISDGVARIESIKGNSVVWNQLLDGTWGGSYEKDGDIVKVIGASYTSARRTLTAIPIGHKVLFGAVVRGGKGTIQLQDGSQNIAFEASDSWKFIGEIKSIIVDNSTVFYLYKTGDDDVEFKDIFFHDLTKMFQAGNEPSTIEEFNARKPLNIDEYAYNEGEVIHMDVQSIESVGVNQWDEEWEQGGIASASGLPITLAGAIRSKNFSPIFPSTSYYVNWAAYTGDKYIFFYDREQNFISKSSFASNGAVNTPSNAAYFKIRIDQGSSFHKDICINRYDTAINGKYFPYIKRVEDLSLVRKYFPQGMKSAPTAHDAIRYNKESGKWEKVEATGIRAYQEGDADNAAYLTDGKVTCYPLAEPIVTELDEADQFKDLDYQVWNAGTEKAIAEGKSAPLAADITYGFNAIGKIKELESLVAALRAKVGI